MEETGAQENRQEPERTGEENFNIEEVHVRIDLENLQADDPGSESELETPDAVMTVEDQAPGHNESEELDLYPALQIETLEEVPLDEDSEDGDPELPDILAADWNVPIEVLLKVFECSKCKRPIRPPIYQCTQGHLKCLDCSGKFLTQLASPCRECGLICQRSRNVALDKIAAHLPFPCRNVRSGCTVRQRLQNIEEHEEKECPYRKIACPYSQLGLCSYWNGTKLQLVPHLLAQHPRSMNRGHGVTRVMYGQEVTLLPVIESINYGSSLPTTTMMWTFIQHAFGNMFLISLYFMHNGVVNVHFVTVRMVDTVTKARRYRSKISLEGPDGEQLSYEGICHSIFENTDYIYKNRDCLSFDNNSAIRYIKTLPNGHNALKFYCKISTA